MANTIRITSAGNYYANSFDEVTFNANSGVIKNLLSYSKNLSISPWQLNSSNAVATTATTDPLNQFDAFKLVENTALTSHYTTQLNISKNPNSIITFSVYAKAAERTGLGLVINAIVGGYVNRYGAEFNLATGTASNHDGAQSTYTNGSFSITPIGSNGWYRCSITCTTGSENLIQIRLFSLIPVTTWTSGPTYQGDGVSGIYFYGPQVEAGNQATIYEPTGANALPASNSVSKIDSNGNNYITGQFDEVTYNPSSNTFVNLINSSQNLSAGNWGFTTAVTVSGTLYTDPDGTKTAQDLIETAATNGHYIGNYCTAVQGLNYTWSIYLKKGVGSTAPDWVQLYGYFLNFNSAYVNFNLNTGTVGVQAGVVRASMTDAGNGWWRCSMTVTSTVNTTTGWMFVGFVNNLNQSVRGPSYAGATTSDVLVWGAQLEQNSVASIYQPINASNLITSTFAQRVVNTGNTYVKGLYSESGLLPVSDSSLILNLDAGNETSYNGTGTNWTDISGSNNVIKLNNSPAYSQDNFGTFILNGTNQDFSNVSPMSVTQFNGLANYSFGIWFKINFSILNNQVNSYNRIIGHETRINGSNRDGYNFIINNNGNGTITISSERWNNNLSYSTLFLPGASSSNYYDKWTYATATFDGSNVKLYINGSLVATGSSGAGSITSNSSMYIGSAGGYSYFPGSLAMVHFYNRALSATEVLNNFNGLRNRFGV